MTTNELAAGSAPLEVVPRCTVLLPARDAQRWIAECIDSVLQQTFTDYEFVIVDDGSTDDTPMIIDKYDDSRIVRLQTPGYGLAAALNYGIAHSRAALIARIDADDRVHNDWLLSMVDFMDTHASVGLLGCWCREIGPDSHVLRARRFPLEDSEIRKYLPVFSVILHSGCMYRRAVIIENGMYDESMQVAEDIDLWLRLAPVIKFANLPRYLVDVRRRIESLSTLRAYELRICHHSSACRYIKNERLLGRISEGEAFFKEAVLCYYHGQQELSVLLFRKAMRSGYPKWQCLRYVVPILVLGRAQSVLREAGVLSLVSRPFKRIKVLRSFFAP